MSGLKAGMIILVPDINCEVKNVRATSLSATGSSRNIQVANCLVTVELSGLEQGGDPLKDKGLREPHDPRNSVSWNQHLLSCWNSVLDQMRMELVLRGSKHFLNCVTSSGLSTHWVRGCSALQREGGRYLMIPAVPGGTTILWFCGGLWDPWPCLHLQNCASPEQLVYPPVGWLWSLVEATALLPLGAGQLGAGTSQHAPGAQTSALDRLTSLPLTQFPYNLYF